VLFYLLTVKSATGSNIKQTLLKKHEVLTFTKNVKLKNVEFFAASTYPTDQIYLKK